MRRSFLGHSWPATRLSEVCRPLSGSTACFLESIKTPGRHSPLPTVSGVWQEILYSCWETYSAPPHVSSRHHASCRNGPPDRRADQAVRLGPTDPRGLVAGLHGWRPHHHVRHHPRQHAARESAPQAHLDRGQHNNASAANTCGPHANYYSRSLCLLSQTDSLSSSTLPRGAGSSPRPSSRSSRRGHCIMSLHG